MKNYFPFIALLIAGALAPSLDAQADLQWFILKGLGKNGIKSSTQLPVNDYRDAIDHDTFNISGYYHPQSLRGKNEFLVIYTDGTYFNSQGDTHFFPKPSTPSTISSHNFIVPPGKKISALYATRNYEGDDPPDKIKVTNRPDGNAYSYSMGVTTPDSTITANHAVVRNRDITLILDLNSLRQKTRSAIVLLHSNNLLDNNGTILSLDSCFTQNPVFQSSSYGGGSWEFSYPSGVITASETQGVFRIHLDNQFQFAYLNLRPTNSLNNYYHDSTGSQAYSALFEVKENNGNNLFRHAEALLDAFDPNRLILDSLITDDGKNVYAIYHIEFENTGEIAVNSDLSLSFEFPIDFTELCENQIVWQIGLNTVRTDAETLYGRKVILKPAPDQRYVLEGCPLRMENDALGEKPGNTPQRCSSSMRMAVKLRRSVPIRYFEDKTPLVPNSCTVRFGSIGKELEIKTYTDATIKIPFLKLEKRITKIPRIVIPVHMKLACE